MRFVLTVEVEVERTEGKFASRADLASQLVDALSGADPGELEGVDGGIYTVVDFGVSSDDI